jgi:hypothetical protein
VTAINGKRFKKQDDYLDATAQAAQQPTYAVEYMRDGNKMTATLERQFRPAITQTLAASPTVAAPTPVATPTASIADELDKLVKLRDSGVLTVAEFEAQKQKLLAQ